MAKKSYSITCMVILFIIVGVSLGFSIWTSVKLRDSKTENFACAHTQGLPTGGRESYCVQGTGHSGDSEDDTPIDLKKLEDVKIPPNFLKN